MTKRTTSGLTTWGDEARIALGNLTDYAASFVTPTLRFGVTGLSRSGKTVFLSALVHNLLNDGRLPLFSAKAEGRITKMYLEPQPDQNIARFRYEDHIENLIDERVWPTSTNRISQLRLTVEYTSKSLLAKAIGGGRLHIDIVDYPGEWLLDLPLLGKSYADWSAEALEIAQRPNRADIAEEWLEMTAKTEPSGDADESVVQQLAEEFTSYLKTCRRTDRALSMLPPGRFLMPGDLEGSPAVTFAPLPPIEGIAPRGSLWALMERRFEAYKDVVIKPFFRDHFARLDRQIVLVDALSALNAGEDAVEDMEAALAEVLTCFRPGQSNWLSGILSKRIDKILFAATKADHLHHSQHEHLEGILRHLVDGAMKRASFSGANVSSIALASVRATQEAVFEDNGEKLNCIVGMPEAGQTIDGEQFDGATKKAIYPGTLEGVLTKLKRTNSEKEVSQLNFVKFRPPEVKRNALGEAEALPHIRLDQATEFLFGDKLA